MMNKELLNRSLPKNYGLVLLEEVDSTNDYAKRLAKTGGKDRTVVVAMSQTSGKGRKGRKFQSQKNQGIYMTLLLMPELIPQDATRLTIVAAVALHEAISTVTGLKCNIKWPNDIVCEDKKLCGILTEMSTENGKVKHLELGIGVNVYNETFEGEVDSIAISITKAMEIQGIKTEAISIEKLIGAILHSYEKYYKMYLKTCSLSAIKEYYDRYLLNIDRKVTVIEHNGSYEAVAKGIDEDGELLVERDGRLIKVMSGEVSIRGVFGYV